MADYKLFFLYDKALRVLYHKLIKVKRQKRKAWLPTPRHTTNQIPNYEHHNRSLKKRKQLEIQPMSSIHKILKFLIILY